MSELNCRQVRRIVQSFLDGELDDEAARLVSRHLDRCEQCGVEAETLDLVRSALAGLDVGDPDVRRAAAVLDDLPTS